MMNDTYTVSNKKQAKMLLLYLLQNSTDYDKVGTQCPKWICYRV